MTIINSILTLLFRRRKPSLKKGGEDAILNYALELAQEWGEDWLMPIQERLGKAYPSFTRQELDRYNTIAQEAMFFGHNLVYKAKEDGNDITKSEWQTVFLSRYPWVDKRNLSHLYSTGSYYTWKDFG